MYSVLRVISLTSSADAINELAEMMNNIRPESCSRHRGGQISFACSISSDKVWVRQQRDILRFLNEFSSVSDRFSGPEVCTRVDVAIYESDWRENVFAVCLVTGPKLMGALSRLGIELEFTFYGQRRPGAHEKMLKEEMLDDDP